MKFIVSMPATDRNGVCADTPREVSEYVRKYGTDRQRDAIAKAEGEA